MRGTGSQRLCDAVHKTEKISVPYLDTMAWMHDGRPSFRGDPGGLLHPFGQVEVQAGDDNWIRIEMAVRLLGRLRTSKDQQRPNVMPVRGSERIDITRPRFPCIG